MSFIKCSIFIPEIKYNLLAAVAAVDKGYTIKTEKTKFEKGKVIRHQKARM